MKKHIKQNKFEIIFMLFIIILGILNLSKGYQLLYKYINIYIKQIIWLIISILLYYIIVKKIKFKYIYKSRNIILALNILFLILVLFIGANINGTKAWINIFGFSFQPSEFIKISFPLVGIYLFKNKKYLKLFLLYLLISFLILIEPDTGNFVILTIIYLSIIINKKNYKKFIKIVSIIIIFMVSIILILKNNNDFFKNFMNGSLYYRVNRIFNNTENYQINRSLITIGNAKLLPINKNEIITYIPEGTTDFAFAFFIGNFGIILTIIIITLYSSIIFINIIKVKNSKNYFKRKITICYLTIFSFQTIYNILMNLSILPIMGIPLPYLSYGGSNIISYIILLSIVNKKISSNEDKDNNNYKNNLHKVLVGNS